MPQSSQIFAGTDITAALLARAVPLLAYKGAPTSLTTDTTLTADPDLFIPLAANTVYKIELVLLNCSAGTNPGLKYTFTVPSGVTGDYTAVQNNLSGAFQEIDSGSWTATNTCEPDNGVIIKGLLVTGSSAGNLTFTWAQDTSSATPATVGTYSYLEAKQAL